MSNSWLQTLKNAKKTCIQQGNLRKVHYELPEEKEMVEEYNMDSGTVTRRAWKLKKKVGGEGQWFIEVGDPEPESQSAGDGLLIKENPAEPVVSRRVTREYLEWRIRNLSYPVETYSITADDTQNRLILRTTNKKYYKSLDIPELQRLNLKPKQNAIKFTHKFNTLVITYKKPKELLDFEKSLFEEIKVLPTKKGDMDCKPS